MATVCIYVGQCGNQLGHQIDELKLGNETLLNYPSSSTSSSSSLEKCRKYRRSVMIDTESKVVGRLDCVQTQVPAHKNRNKIIVSQTMREGSIIAGRRGRGNNWALGYEGIGTEKILDASIESIRREAERCDVFSNLLIAHSLCGGTGGGMGSRLLETLRGEFRLEHIISCVVAPFLSGDTPLQHYNALLSLTSLQKFSDAVLLFKNDMVSRHCSRKGAQGAGVSFGDMNRYMAECLTGICTPTDTLTPLRGFGCELELSEIVRSLCPQPSLKFLTINHVTRQSSDVKAMCNAVIGRTKLENMGTKCHSLSNVAVIRGPETQTNSYSILPAMEQRIKKELNCVGWNAFPVDYWLASQALAGAKAGSHNVTLASNYSNIIPYAEHIWVKAKQMYEQKAYLHWYYKHGLSDDYFEEAFTTVEDIIGNYSEAVR